MRCCCGGAMDLAPGTPLCGADLAVLWNRGRHGKRFWRGAGWCQVPEALARRAQQHGPNRRRAGSACSHRQPARGSGAAGAGYPSPRISDVRALPLLLWRLRLRLPHPRIGWDATGRREPIRLAFFWGGDRADEASAQELQELQAVVFDCQEQARELPVLMRLFESEVVASASTSVGPCATAAPLAATRCTHHWHLRDPCRPRLPPSVGLQRSGKVETEVLEQFYHRRQKVKPRASGWSCKGLAVARPQRSALLSNAT